MPVDCSTVADIRCDCQALAGACPAAAHPQTRAHFFLISGLYSYGLHEVVDVRAFVRAGLSACTDKACTHCTHKVDARKNKNARGQAYYLINVIADSLMAYVLIANIVMACTVMPYVVMADVVMTDRNVNADVWQDERHARNRCTTCTNIYGRNGRSGVGIDAAQ